MKPKIRLKGYSGDWSTHILSEIGFMTAGGTPSTFIDEYWNGEINWLQSGAIQNKTISTKSAFQITHFLCA